MSESLDSWFKREILPHEAALLHYVARVWPRRNEVHDLCQETYARVYDSAKTARPQAARSFLFTTAHNLMTDLIRRERVVSIEAVGDIDALNVLIDEAGPEQRFIAREELKRLARAFDLLPPRCREVVWLRRVQELPQKEVARLLGIDEKTVEKHVSKGGRLLAEYMLGGDAAATRPQAEIVAEGLEPGKTDEYGKRHGD